MPTLDCDQDLLYIEFLVWVEKGRQLSDRVLMRPKVIVIIRRSLEHDHGVVSTVDSFITVDSSLAKNDWVWYVIFCHDCLPLLARCSATSACGVS